MTGGGAWRPRVSHGRFAIVFTILLFGACNALNADKLVRWFREGSGYDYSALLAYLVAGLCLFLVSFLLLAHRWTIKPLAAALVASSAAATYFIGKYDVAIDSSMVLNTLHTDGTEVAQLLSLGMMPYVVAMIVVLAAIACVEISFADSGRYLFQSGGLVAAALAIAAAALYPNYHAIHRAGNVSNKYVVYSLVPINVISGTASALSKLAKPYLASNRRVEISGRVATPGDLVVVLAIGESSRRSSFSVYGYDRRDTNPTLRATPGLRLLEGKARRGSTLYALPEILEKDDVKLPMLVSRLGIPTACYVNYTLYDNCTEPGEVKVGPCGHGGRCYDEDVIPLLENNLAGYRSGYRFVVLHLGGGSHGPTYSDRHPPEFLRFEPSCRDADVANRCSLDEVYNAYDNTILYVDFVLGGIIERLEQSGAPYVLIYLSDHGESLMEGGRMFHGMPPGIPLPPEQAEIPLIVKASVPIRIVERSHYPQSDVFDTVLGLFSIETPVAERERRFIERTAGPTG